MQYENFCYIILVVIKMTIKEIRTKKKLTQQEAADLLGLSLRTYQNYELEVSKRDKLKIDYIKKTLSEYERITPTKVYFHLRK